ncbi:MAG: TIM barrel protein [Phycisphaeraceae bacterium]
MAIKQSVVVPIFHEPDQPREAFCQQMAEVGLDGIELWGRAECTAWAEAARSAGLTLVSFVGHGTLEHGLNDPDAHDRIEQELRDAIDVAAAHGVPGVIAFAGNRRTGQSDYDGMVVCAKGLRRIAGYAEEQGVNINVELLNSRVDHPAYLADASDWGYALCEMVDRPRVKLLFDIYHMQIMEGNVIANLQRGIRWIGHVHTAGVPGRHDLDDTQELNYTGICRALAEAGYDGYVGHEFWPRGEKLAALRQARALCDVGISAR